MHLDDLESTMYGTVHFALAFRCTRIQGSMTPMISDEGLKQICLKFFKIQTLTTNCPSVLECAHTMPARFENGEKCEGQASCSHEDGTLFAGRF